MSEWTGRWSDGSKEWTREVTKQWLGLLKVLDHEFGNDGTFIMEYEDFQKVWTEIDRTELFDPTWIQSSHWLNVTTRPAPCAWQYGDVSCTHHVHVRRDVQSVNRQPKLHSACQNHRPQRSFFPKRMTDSGENSLGAGPGLWISCFLSGILSGLLVDPPLVSLGVLHWQRTSTQGTMFCM
jgi:Calpain family cysteine protease